MNTFVPSLLSLFLLTGPPVDEPLVTRNPAGPSGQSNPECNGPADSHGRKQATGSLDCNFDLQILVPMSTVDQSQEVLGLYVQVVNYSKSYGFDCEGDPLTAECNHGYNVTFVEFLEVRFDDVDANTPEGEGRTKNLHDTLSVSAVGMGCDAKLVARGKFISNQDPAFNALHNRLTTNDHSDPKEKIDENGNKIKFRVISNTPADSINIGEFSGGKLLNPEFDPSSTDAAPPGADAGSSGWDHDNDPTTDALPTTEDLIDACTTTVYSVPTPHSAHVRWDCCPENTIMEPSCSPQQ